ncbi:RNA ligase family protein [Variovorax soli]|uniref:Bifunctional non-homologous end joining protein LigD n=1 Tax=Variovorax soli TaxID=376815 RepID=A0ABU1NK64_9BURK|nr:RNA ligase family protein [Variovorax soli]MDR6538868.1 bifunctional non-homologous end joining protein LigD [Variovorax soli]
MPLALANLKPMLLDERLLPWGDQAWIYELKFDGYRVLAEFGHGSARLKTRNGADCTAWFPELARSLASVKGGPHIADGEVCVLDEYGRSSFDRLQDRARRRRWYEGADPVTYCVFDLLQENGKDITQMPLLKRKARMLKRLAGVPSVLPMTHIAAEQGAELFEMAKQLRLEGLVAKKGDSVYKPGVRSSDWVKIKRKGAIPPERFRR